MMTLNTINPVEVVSSATGKASRRTSTPNEQAQRNRLFSESNRTARKNTRQSSREEKRDLKTQKRSGELSKADYRSAKKALRKKKLGAIKLQLTKRFVRGGKPLFLYRLPKLKKRSDGKFVKTYNDGRQQEIANKNVVQTPQGYYDLTEIAKVLNISLEELKAGQDQIIKSLLPLPAETKDQPTADPDPAKQADPNADLAALPPQDNVVDGGDGSTYLAEDTYATDATGAPLNANESTSVAESDEKRQNPPLKPWEKGLIIGGIAVVLITVGVVIYKKIKSNGQGA